MFNVNVFHIPMLHNLQMVNVWCAKKTATEKNVTHVKLRSSYMWPYTTYKVSDKPGNGMIIPLQTDKNPSKKNVKGF